MFQALWWKPEERDPAIFWPALESFESGCGWRACPASTPPLRAHLPALQRVQALPWIGGLEQQNAGRMLDGKGHNGVPADRPDVLMPFSRSWNETEDGTHYPKLSTCSTSRTSPASACA